MRGLLIAGAVPVGGLVGLAAWLLAGGADADATRLAALETRVSALRPRGAAATSVAPDVGALAGAPLFPLTTGPGAVPPPALRLDGLTRVRGRAAALLAIADQPAEWLQVGDSRAGVTLIEVGGAGVTLDTLYGPVEVGLGQSVGGTVAAPVAVATAAPAVPPVSQTLMDVPPPGVRVPPPPASAPR